MFIKRSNKAPVVDFQQNNFFKLLDIDVLAEQPVSKQGIN